ncbi:unnamed protein product [Mycena citricolor]|uniref:Ribosome assembly protein 3 n=1 Tax=Mycena citricolor TaxID=2018698 RepID=A0AAD2H677_9AGAR|nr:unnamed protein product [Mycena citricolor]
MPPSTSAPRKRVRKRKRRALSISPDSSAISSDSETEATPSKPTPAPAPLPPPAEATSSSEDSSDSDSSDSSSSSEGDASPSAKIISQSATTVNAHAPNLRRNTPSPPPTSVPLPSFLPPADAPDYENAENRLKERFRKFWMSSVADGFKDDLEEIRLKEPNLGTSRLALLIDSLASGADVFSSSTRNGQVNEMEIVLE